MLDICDNIVRAIAREASPVHLRPIVKMVMPNKLYLDLENDPLKRIDYLEWLKAKIGGQREVIFIMSNETPVHIGGPPRKEKQSVY